MANSKQMAMTDAQQISLETGCTIEVAMFCLDAKGGDLTKATALARLKMAPRMWTPEPAKSSPTSQVVTAANSRDCADCGRVKSSVNSSGRCASCRRRPLR